jgi:hypothetical protein
MLTPPTTTVVAREGAALALCEDEAEARWANLPAPQRAKLTTLEDRGRALAATLRALQGRRGELASQIARDEQTIRDAEQSGPRLIQTSPTSRRTVAPEVPPAVRARRDRLADEGQRVAAEIESIEAALHAARAVARNCRTFLQLPPVLL